MSETTHITLGGIALGITLIAEPLPRLLTVSAASLRFSVVHEFVDTEIAWKWLRDRCCFYRAIVFVLLICSVCQGAQHSERDSRPLTR